MHTIIGLGNPGVRYASSRHNVGFWLCNYLAEHWPATNFAFQKYANAEIAHTTIADTAVLLVKPQTFMNNSGEAVKFIVANEKLEPAEDLLVVNDDIDLSLGILRLAYNRSAGGHRGLQSIIDQLRTMEFTRLRIGISPLNENGETFKPKTADGINPFVMGNFKDSERSQMEEIFSVAEEMLVAWITEGRETTMNRFHHPLS